MESEPERAVGSTGLLIFGVVFAWRVSTTWEDWRRELAVVGGAFLRKRARSEAASAFMLRLPRLSSRRQCARRVSAAVVVVAAVAVTEDRRVAVVEDGVVLGVSMGRAAAGEGIDRRHGALSHLVCQLSRPINTGSWGRNATGQMCLSKTLSKEMPRGKAVVVSAAIHQRALAREASWYSSRCDNQSKCLIKARDA
jgi:hypothetical protein